MLLDLFKYFATFPKRENVLKGIANKGESSMKEYAKMVEAIKNLPGEDGIVPQIENYVYGQSFEELKERLSKLVGSFLFVDYGEVDMQSDGRRSFECTQRIAVTVAMKLPATHDMMERLIANERTLQMLSQVHAHLMADAEMDILYWMDRDSVTTCEIVPFVSAELQSYGWTMMLNATGADILKTHSLAKRLMH